MDNASRIGNEDLPRPSVILHTPVAEEDFSRERGCPRALGVIKFAFFNDAFVRFAAALDPVLDLSVTAGQFAKHLVIAACGASIRKAPVQSDALPDFEAGFRVRLQLLDRVHDRTRNEVL